MAASAGGTATRSNGAILGLVIWGLLMISLVLLEARAISSALGYLLRVVSGSLRGATTLAETLVKSENGTNTFLSRIRDSVRKEIFRPGVWEQLRTYFEGLKAAYEEPVGMTRDEAQSYAQKLGTAASQAAADITRESHPSFEGHPYAATATVDEDEVHRPRLNYNAIRSDILKLLHDPKAGADALLQRLREVDRETLRSILRDREDLSSEEVEKIISQIESARDELILKAQRMKAEVEYRIETAQAEAQIRFREARESASVAAAWCVGIAAISALAAILGGLVGA
jgi:ElaB/YqjD/DUF883 family membrane-anchored ribosome-binding protein